MRIKILRSAQEDLAAGRRFYEGNSQGIGDYFIDSLFSDIESPINAGVQAIHFGKYQRLLSKRFPFAIYYRVEDEVIYVYAVLDCRRSPAWQRNKLSKIS